MGWSVRRPRAESREGDGEMVLTFFLPGRLPSLSNVRVHYMEKARIVKLWREKTYLVATDAMNRAGYSIPANVPKRVTATIHGEALLDFGNDWSALKPVFDGLQDARLIHSDRRDSGHALQVDSVMCQPPGVLVTVSWEAEALGS